jgi:REP element-mobilizing transposase RayT
MRQWKSEQKKWLASHPEPHTEKDRAKYFRLFTERIQNWLDAGFGSCILARPKAKSIVEEALAYFNGNRYALDEFIVMPNHVHVLVAPLAEHELSDILHAWKSFTARAILKEVPEAGSLFSLRAKRRDGASTLAYRVWQKESFDHIVRSPAQLDRIRRYIRDNPKTLEK